MSTSRRQRGLTMIELILFIVIVGIAVIGVLQVISLNTGRSADPLLRKQAVAIAEGLLEEVRSAGFTFCDAADPAVETVTSAAGCSKPEGVGPENGNARPFDNINDYVTAYDRAIPYTQDMAGNALPPGYAATLTISQVANFGATAVPAGTALRITVRVAFGNESVVLETVRTQFSPNVPI